jgi:hypothetical protein
MFRIFQKGAAIPDHLKIQREHNLNPFAPMQALIRRLCLRPPDPYIVGKLRLSAVLLVWGVKLTCLLTKMCQSVTSV